VLWKRKSQNRLNLLVFSSSLSLALFMLIMKLRKLIIDINNIVIFMGFSLTHIEFVLIGFNPAVEFLNA